MNHAARHRHGAGKAPRDGGGTTFPIYYRRLYAKDVIMTPNVMLEEVYPEGYRLFAVLKNEYAGAEEERVVDQVVVNGTRADDVLYRALMEVSRCT